MVSQEQLLRQRQLQQAATAPAQVAPPPVKARSPRKDKRVHTNRIISHSSPELMQVAGELHGLIWQFEKRQLDLLEVMATSERQFQTARRVAMDNIAQMEALVVAYVKQQLSDVLGAIAALEAPEEAN